MSESISQHRHGEVVVDRDDEDPNRAVVINRPPTTAADWRVEGRGTLAEDNPQYPADDRVICVAFLDDLLAEFPYYGGIDAISLSTCRKRGMKFYAFPNSRLRQVGTIGPHEVPLDSVVDSPFHVREFDLSENEEFVEDTRERGEALRPVFARVLREEGDHKFELLNGHKRTWAARQAGLETVRINGIYCDDKRAANRFVECHLLGSADDAYRGETREEALTRLHGALGDDLVDLDGISPDDVQMVAPTERLADGD